jgi:hypothetical protein
MIPPVKIELVSDAVAGVTTGNFWLSHMTTTSAAVDICGAILAAFCLGAFLFHRRKIVTRHLNALPPRVHLKSFDRWQPKASNDNFLGCVRLHWAQHANFKSENKLPRRRALGVVASPERLS